MKLLKLLLLISILLLCGCSSNKDIPENTVTVTPSPSLSQFNDEIFSCTYDSSLLQCCSDISSSSVQHGLAFSSVNADIKSSITDGSCVYTGVIPYKSPELYNSLQQYPELCVSSLFSGIFGISDTQQATVDINNNIYEYRITSGGYMCKGKLLHYNETSYVVLVYKVSENEDGNLITSFNNVYDSIALNPEYTSPSTSALEKFEDSVISCTYDCSLLQLLTPLESDSFLYASLFTGAGTDFSAEATSGNSIIVATIKSSSSDIYATMKAAPDLCVKVLFDSAFSVADSTATVQYNDGLYEYTLLNSGYCYKGKLLTFDSESFTIVLYKVSESEDHCLVTAFDNLYDSIALNPNFTSTSAN